VCEAYIEESFTFETQIKKADIMKLCCDADTSDRVHPASKNLDHIELFRTFKKYDRNMNGTLDFAEYT